MKRLKNELYKNILLEFSETNIGFSYKFRFSFGIKLLSLVERHSFLGKKFNNSSSCNCKVMELAPKAIDKHYWYSLIG